MTTDSTPEAHDLIMLESQNECHLQVIIWGEQAENFTFKIEESLM